MDDECIHGLGPIEACTICNGKDKARAKLEKENPRLFPASYPGQCEGCGLPIVIGQTIAWLPETRPTHEGCWQ